MKIISFGETTPALLARRKTVTRRKWKAEYATRFHRGELCSAYDTAPFNHGKQVAVIRLTAPPILEETGPSLPVGDWEAEGFAYLAGKGFRVFKKDPKDVWADWIDHPQKLWVVRFEVVEFNPLARA